jgi:hypothetical protein
MKLGKLGAFVAFDSLPARLLNPIVVIQALVDGEWRAGRTVIILMWASPAMTSMSLRPGPVLPA